MEYSKEESRFSYYATRILSLDDECLLNPERTSELVEQIFELNARAHDPIMLIVNSNGGPMTQTFLVIDVIRSIASPVHTQIMGVAASAGCFIAMCGAPGGRYASSLSRIMLHQPQIVGEMHGDATQMAIEQREVSRLKSQLLDLTADATGRTGDRRAISQLKRDMERDRWFSPVEAVEYGLVDHIGISPLLSEMPVPPLEVA